MTKKIEPHPEDEMARWRRARDEFSAQFKSLDEMFEFLQKADQERARKLHASKSTRRPARLRRKALAPVSPRAHARA